jgi:hypothetical protein
MITSSKDNNYKPSTTVLIFEAHAQQMKPLAEQWADY